MKYIILIVSTVALVSCQKGIEKLQSEPYDCVFEQIDEDMDGAIDDYERSLMEGCTESKLTSKESIEANIIGEWELFGFGHGWSHSISQPCGYITISEEELVLDFHNDQIDTVTTYAWEVEEIMLHGRPEFRLSTDVLSFGALDLNQFCDDYMYRDHTPLDGLMYLYKRVK